MRKYNDYFMVEQRTQNRRDIIYKTKKTDSKAFIFDKKICILRFPLILDGTIQHFTSYNSNNLKRVLTGFLYGIAFMSLITKFFSKNNIKKNIQETINENSLH